MRYTLFDMNNLVHRSWHSLKKRVRGFDNLTQMQKSSLVISSTLQIIKSSYNIFIPQATVFCFDNKSWRKEYYKDYRLARRNNIKNPADIEQSENIGFIIESLLELFRTTNSYILEHNKIEADDWIAGWIHYHKEDEHLIITRDSDLKQLVSAGTCLFDPTPKILYTTRGLYLKEEKSDNNNELLYNVEWSKLLDKNNDHIMFDPGWELFEKIIRGDKSDDIPSSYPNVLTKTLKKVYYDNDIIQWNNFLNNTKFIIDGNEVLLKERYELNKRLIDLSYQPDDIKIIINNTIEQVINEPNHTMTELNFIEFLNKFKLYKIKDNMEEYLKIFEKIKS